MKSTPKVPGSIPLMTIGDQCNPRKVPGFIATEGGGSTEPGDPYLSRFPDIYYDLSVRPIVRPHFLGRYFNACNAIENHNRMRQSDLALEKYWVTQSGYFRLATTVALGMGIADGNLLFCHGISEESVDKKISAREYNNSAVYECCNNPFTSDFGSPALNLPPITIDDRPHPHKISRYTPDLLPSTISVASENSVKALTTPFDFTDILLYDDPNTLHVMKKDVTYQGMSNIRYCGRKHDQNRCYKNKRLYCST